MTPDLREQHRILTAYMELIAANVEAMQKMPQTATIVMGLAWFRQELRSVNTWAESLLVQIKS